MDPLLQAILDDIRVYVGQNVREFADQVLTDSKDFLQSAKDDLQTWTAAVARGELDQAGFESLLRGKQDLLEMRALTEAGLAQVRVDTIRNAIIGIVIDRALGELG
ncbi:hypothetical protein KQI52_14705 [bacterium]|nr:hypothetical protein [bacterium]